VEEIWKPVPGYDNRYEASNLGRIKALTYGKGQSKTDLILKSWISNAGYEGVKIWHNKKHITKQVHQLVATAFHGLCPDNMEVNHIDKNKLNNVPENLTYVTRLENMRLRDIFNCKRKRNLVKEDILEILLLLGAGESENRIAEKLHISVMSIRVVKLTSEVLSSKQEAVLV
jgi:hypothetical protein